MKKRGFTLIELLAIIGIIGVIALITVPIVFNIFKNVRKNSYHRTVDYVEKSAELFHKNNYDLFNRSIDNDEKYTDRLEFTCKNNECITTSSGKIGTFSFTSSVGEGYLILYKNGSMEYALTDNEFCVTKYLTDKQSTITEGNCADISFASDRTPATISNLSSSSTTKSITVVINAYDSESGILGYSCSLDGTNYSEISDSPICEFQDLETGEYTVYVKVYNNAHGQEGTTDAETVTEDSIDVATVPIDMPGISVDPKNEWSQVKVVTIDNPNMSGIKTYYSIDDCETWTEGNSLVVTENDTTVIAKYTDGINTVQASSFVVTKIDRTAPSLSIKPSFSPKTIVVDASGNDEQSEIYGYQFGISSDDGVTWQMTNIQETAQYVFKNLNVGSYDIKVIIYNKAYQNTGDTYKNIELGTKTIVYENIVATSCPEPEIELDSYNNGWVQSRNAEIDYGDIKECIPSYAIFDENQNQISTGNSANVTIETNNTTIAASNTVGSIVAQSSSSKITNIDSSAPTSSTNAIDLIDHGIHIVAYGEDAQSDIARYSFSIDNGTTWTDWQESSTYTFTNLALTSYTVKSRVWNGTFGSPGATIAKGVLESSATTVTVGSCVPPTFEFVNNDANIWTQSKMIKINTPNGFSAYYKLDDNDDYVAGDIINVVTNGQEISAQIRNGNNICNSTNNLKVMKIDRTNPITSNHSTVKNESESNNSITVVASGEDSETNITMYNYSISQNSTDHWTGWLSDQTHIFNNLDAGTYYIKTKVWNETYGTTGATEEYGVLDSDTSEVTIVATCPVPTFTYSPTSACASSRTVTIDYGNVVGCIGTYSKDGASYQAGNSVTFDSNGYVTAQNVNSAGTIQNDTFNVIGVYPDVPTASISLTSGGSTISSGATVSSNVTATLTCNTTGTSENMGYYIAVKDSSGNVYKTSSSSTLTFTPENGESTIEAYCTSCSGVQSAKKTATVNKQGLTSCESVSAYCSSHDCAGVGSNVSACEDACHAAGNTNCSSCSSDATASHTRCMNNCIETRAEQNGLTCSTSSDPSSGTSTENESCMAGGGYSVSGVASDGYSLCGGGGDTVSCTTPSGNTLSGYCTAGSGANCTGTAGGNWDCTCNVLCELF